MFDTRALSFLADLSAHNERAWFEAHRARYEAEVRQPALAFIRAMGGPLTEFAPRFVASDKTVGGSLMRAHRDTRFSKDKTPYKTNIGIQFRHQRGKDVHAPGFYLHIAVDEVFVGVGSWHPEPESLAQLRAAIDGRPEAWAAAVDDPRFVRAFTRTGDVARSVPKAFAKDHPLAAELRRKDHLAVAHPAFDEVCGTAGVARVAALFEASAPYMRFLTEAVGLPY